MAAEAIAGRTVSTERPGFTSFVDEQQQELDRRLDTQSPFPSVYLRDQLADTMRINLGIVRDQDSLQQGISDIDYDLSVAGRIRYDSSVSPYVNYSLPGILTLARATVSCAQFRRESRGAHYRSDCPETDEAWQYATIISYDNARYTARLDKEQDYER